jgi:hypothetical protein
VRRRWGWVMRGEGGTAYKKLSYKPHTVLIYNHFTQFLYTAS